MSEIKIYDKFLSPIEYSIIRDEIMSEQWSWEFSDKITTVHDQGADYGQFVKVLYMFNIGRRKEFQIIEPIIAKIHDVGDSNEIAILRAKINCNPKLENVVQLGDYHNDFQFDCHTAIYYLTDSNGPTKFANGEVVDCVSNRLIIFPSHMKHCGFSCSDSLRRVVVNINYLPLYHGYKKDED